MNPFPLNVDRCRGSGCTNCLSRRLRIGTSCDGAGNALTAIAPCRLVDTRAASNVGPLAGPPGPGQTATFTATGDNGDCAGIPADAEVVEVQLTPVGATADTFWTAYPSDLVTRPNVSQLNPRVALATTSNSTIVTLSETGQFSLYNAAGMSNVVIGILAYYSSPSNTFAKIATATCPGGKVAIGGGPLDWWCRSPDCNYSEQSDNKHGVDGKYNEH